MLRAETGHVGGIVSNKERSTHSEGMPRGWVADGQVERKKSERRLIEHKWGWACSGVPGIQAIPGVTVYMRSVGMKINDKWKGMH